jgi:putative colanic acid biosynthesis acetyltransferase WcaF
MTFGRMIDVGHNRQSRKWSRREQAARVLWVLARPAFTWSPRPLWGWRRMLLRLFGAKVGRGVHIYPTVRITMPWNVAIGDDSAVGDRALLYSLGQITIGSCVTISQQAHLCAGTHDYKKRDFPLVKAPIGISDGAWVCADAFVGPNVVVGEGAILGARGVAVKDIPPGVIAAGNPAKILKARSKVLT